MAPPQAPACADPSGLPTADAVAPVSEATTPSGIRIVAMRCGWVGVKHTHRELDVPAPFAVPSIFLGRQWAPWMPIFAYAVQHPAGATVLVDTGPSERVNDADYYSADPFNEVFYKRNLRFHLPEGRGDTLVPRLAQAGIAPSAVDTLLITHFHGDHVGCVDAVAHARGLTGPGNWPTHVGAFTARLPRGWTPEAAVYTPAPSPSMPASPPSAAVMALDDLFPATQRLTPDGAVRVVPLPGHTPGHVGLAVVDGGRVWLVAGDATFDDDQTRRCGVCGVSQDVSIARETQHRLRALLERGGPGEVVLLPSHDPAVPGRLSASCCKP